VWDGTFDPFTNTIEVYVNRLRREIDEPAIKPLIHTRRGAGYMLVAASDEASSGDAVGDGTQKRTDSREKAKASALKPTGEPRGAGKKHI